MKTSDKEAAARRQALLARLKNNNQTIEKLDTVEKNAQAAAKEHHVRASEADKRATVWAEREKEATARLQYYSREADKAYQDGNKVFNQHMAEAAKRNGLASLIPPVGGSSGGRGF